VTDDDLRNGPRQMPRQRGLSQSAMGEAHQAPRSGEPERAIGEPAHPRWQNLMEEVVAHDNLARALKRVCRNQGSPGIDGMTVEELSGYVQRHEETLRAQLLAGTFTPKPVRRVGIPKSDGGERELGIPTVVDRLVQQAISQVLGPRFDAGFSPYSHGFRPGHSAHAAVLEAQRHIQSGYDWVVDVDLERFFDRVNHDVLMGRLAKRIDDPRILRIIRRFLEAGMMVNGVVMDREEGTPQGGPLSPLLANVLLDDLDKALEARGHRFVRYADDCNVYVRSERAGHRVMAMMRTELTRLRLRINEAKSAVDRPWNRRFLGYSFRGQQARRRVSPRALEKLKDRIRVLTNRNRGVSLARVVHDVAQYLRGWKAYFHLCEVPSPRMVIERWIRSRLRTYQLKLWWSAKRIYFGLVALGAPKAAAAATARLARRWWTATLSIGAQLGLPDPHFNQLGLPRIDW
jgi:RNA-directed DNA polymerase